MSSGMILAAADHGGTQLTGLLGWAAEVMTAMGAAGIGVLVLVENLFPPIPSEPILALGGFLARQGHLDPIALAVAATVGSVLGALMLYALGALLGPRRSRRLITALPLISERDVDKAEAWFGRHGGKAVLLGRMVPVVRSLISLPAGVQRMPLPRFIAYTTVGSGIWNALFLILGYVLADRWQNVGQYSDLLNYLTLGVIAVATAVFVVRRLRRTTAAPLDPDRHR